MQYNDIQTKEEPLTKDEIETCEKVLKWAAESSLLTFDHKECQTVLSRTTNILRWSNHMEMLSLPLASEGGEPYGS